MSPLGTSAINWPIGPAPDDKRVWSSWWNENLQGKLKYSEKTCPSATLTTMNPTLPDLGSNMGCRGGKRRLTAWTMARPRLMGNPSLGRAIFQTYKGHEKNWSAGGRNDDGNLRASWICEAIYHYTAVMMTKHVRWAINLSYYTRYCYRAQQWILCSLGFIAFSKGCHLDVVRGPSTPHDPESDAGGSLSSW
jgi:hypothetical protein